MPTIIIIRGLPGSGKSTHAKREFPGLLHLEADQYFTRADGRYEWRRDELRHAHAITQTLAGVVMCTGMDLVICGTLTTYSEIQPYLELAESYLYEVRVLRMAGEFRSVHSVPAASIEAMRRRFQDFSGEIITNPKQETDK